MPIETEGETAGALGAGFKAGWIAAMEAAMQSLVEYANFIAAQEGIEDQSQIAAPVLGIAGGLKLLRDKCPQPVMVRSKPGEDPKQALLEAGLDPDDFMDGGTVQVRDPGGVATAHTLVRKRPMH